MCLHATSFWLTERVIIIALLQLHMLCYCFSCRRHKGLTWADSDLVILLSAQLFRKRNVI